MCVCVTECKVGRAGVVWVAMCVSQSSIGRCVVMSEGRIRDRKSVAGPTTYRRAGHSTGRYYNRHCVGPYRSAPICKP